MQPSFVKFILFIIFLFIMFFIFIIFIMIMFREGMAPVQPSFIMFSVKPQGSEAVSVRVVACSNLPDMDGPGNKSDPYVKVILNENKQKTKVAESYRNPVFEEFSSTFTFPLNPMGNEVFFEVWDKDRLSKDDLMGKVVALLI